MKPWCGLVGHPFAGGGVVSLLVLQRVWDAQFVPLRAAKLVESQHVDVFDGITEGLADLRHVFDVLFGVGQAGTSTNRTQIFLPALASRWPKSMVGCKVPPVTL